MTGRRATPELGAEYRDKVTGYQGIATAVTRYLDDPTTSVQVTRMSNDGKPEDVWIPDVRLDPVEKPASGGFK